MTLDQTHINQGTFPTGTLVYIGRRRLRNDAEPDEKQEVLLDICPEAVPHVFVDFGGAKLSRVLEQAGGKQGCVVDAQKVIRVQSTLAEVQAWRAQFDENYAGSALAEAVFFSATIDKKRVGADQVREAVMDAIYNGEPFVVLSFVNSGQSLNVPVQAADLLDRCRERAPIIYEAMFAHLSEEEQLDKAVEIADQLLSLMD